MRCRGKPIAVVPIAAAKDGVGALAWTTFKVGAELYYRACRREPDTTATLLS